MGATIVKMRDDQYNDKFQVAGSVQHYPDSGRDPGFPLFDIYISLSC